MIAIILLLSCCNWTIGAQQSPRSIQDIFEPCIVGVPPSDAYIGLSLMSDGEIRHYNYGEQNDGEQSYYLSSRDSGLTWTQVKLPDGILYADTRSPLSGEYIRAIHTKNGVDVVRTEGGIDGDRTLTKIDDQVAIMLKPPVFVDGGKRVIICGHRMDRKGCFTYVSTDDGRSWKMSNVVNAPLHEKGGFHKGIRWNHGSVEPTVTELADGRLWMIMRTSLDSHYESFSTDGGYTWSEPQVSPFYGTITMPTFLRLEDGRLMFFWANTTPLPEVESADGTWEDVFTNRNAAHVAISEDDGKSWIGMRELLLDTRRNAHDFASAPGRDKSVHQSQAVEIAGGKILVAVGQNEQHRKMLMFDLDWLYEKERECGFENGLANWSAFRYYKGIVGHCGYNRQEAPILIPHPEKKEAHVIKIGYTPNDSLVQDQDGALWNFPAAKNGEIVASVKIPSSSKKISMIVNDRWFNPTDSVAKYECQYLVSLDRKELKIRDDKWHEIVLKWKHNNAAMLYVDGRKRMSIPLVRPSKHGSSYLHFLGGIEPDSTGVLIERVKARIVTDE